MKSDILNTINMPRRLGQHFLQTASILRKVVGFLGGVGDEWVVEIGPGHGELTRYLLEVGWRVVVIEKDEALAARLHNRFSSAIDNKQLVVVVGDVLDRFDEVVSSLGGGYVLAGNIPYAITGRIFRMVGEADHKPRRAVFVVQKEVAERVCAKKGMNLLAASVMVWAQPVYGGTIGRRHFSPPPRVDSAIVAMEIISPEVIRELLAGGSLDNYFSFIRILFAHPRKTARNNLIEGGKNGTVIDQLLVTLSLSSSVRPHQLSMKQVARLYTSL